MSKDVKDSRNSARLDQTQYRMLEYGVVNRLKHTVYNGTQEIVQLNPIQYMNAVLLYSQCPLCHQISKLDFFVFPVGSIQVQYARASELGQFNVHRLRNSHQ